MELAIFGAVVLVILIGFVVKKNKEAKVPQGLQVWDSSGRMVLDTNSWAGRVSGVRSITGSFSFTVPKTAQETVFAIPVTSFTYSNYIRPFTGTLTISGNQISGNFENTTKIIYGVY